MNRRAGAVMLVALAAVVWAAAPDAVSPTVTRAYLPLIVKAPTPRPTPSWATDAPAVACRALVRAGLVCVLDAGLPGERCGGWRGLAVGPYSGSVYVCRGDPAGAMAIERDVSEQCDADPEGCPWLAYSRDASLVVVMMGDTPLKVWTVVDDVIGGLP